MRQDVAILYDTIQAGPHLTLTYTTPDGIAHLLFKNNFDGWWTPCKVNLSAHEANLKDVRYGRPTCFECFADDEDLYAAGTHGRNTLKLYAERKGQHWYVVMFMGALNETLVNVGGVTMLDFEWKEFAAAVVIGGLSTGMRVIIEKEEG